MISRFPATLAVLAAGILTFALPAVAGDYGKGNGDAGASASVSTGTLPFTGVQIRIAALASLIILGAGVAFRRLARPTASVG